MPPLLILQGLLGPGGVVHAGTLPRVVLGKGRISIWSRCQAGLVPEPSWLMVTAVSSPRSASSRMNSSFAALQGRITYTDQLGRAAQP